MGWLKHHKAEGGQGGKRGHSNMCHWVTTEEINEATCRLRRRDAKEVILHAKLEMKENASVDETEYLLRSPANALRLYKALEEIKKGKLITKTLAELGIN